ncbi:Ras-associating and dilute domain-containing protein [Schistosoma japonicum]|uniref:Ras-associating and dilute domain-containing protein n=2 Tax=Schistosoma japonicum TaxID=6182 RepID=A0A4Z2DCM0_SCHJA|nr:Ras-associating and dilute domain-containing protein [Schistosoma japonicum]
MLNRVANLGSSSQIPRDYERNPNKVKKFFRTSRSTSKSRQNVSSSAIWNNHNSSSVSKNNDNNSNKNLPIPMELSWEQVVTKDGFVKHFLKVFCEKVRKGDHFKTIGLIGSTTAGLCVKELVKNHYSKYGTCNDFYLSEIIGRIQPISTLTSSSSPVWSFTEQKIRRIDSNEKILSLFQDTSPGYGLCRRIELRLVDDGHSATGSMLLRESRSVNCSQVSLRDAVSASQTTLNSSRSCTPVNGITYFKDSRRGRAFRGIQIPQGPYFLLLRGNQPSHDVLLHDLTKLIIDNTMQSYVTIGYGKHVDIRMYDTPSEVNSSGGDFIIAKVVGYNVVLDASNSSSSKQSLVFLEPWDRCIDSGVSTSGVMTPSSLHPIHDNIEIYVNNDLVKASYALTFKKQQLRPGDLIFFGSRKRGYVYLFKDPRCIPDHKLELPFTKNENPGVNNVKINRKVEADFSNNDESVPCSSAHNNPIVHSAAVLEGTKQIKPIPEFNELEWIIEPLLLPLKFSDSESPSTSMSASLSISISQQLINLDTLGVWDISTSSILEPWRSACLLSILIRAIGLTKLHNDRDIRIVASSSTTTINSSSNYSVINDVKTKCTGFKTFGSTSIEDNLKQITTILSNYQKRAELTESGRLVFQLWLALFFYDLATYLTPGWLTHDIKCPQISVDTSDNTSSLLSSPITQASENRHQDISKSSLSLNHLFGELLAPETLEEIEEIRKLSYTLADQIIDKLIKTASHSISPYISDLYQCLPYASPVRSQSDRVQFTSPTEWTSSRSELSKWLNQLASCFDVAFYPSGTSMPPTYEAENISINSGSIHSTLSNKSQNGAPFNGVHHQQYHLPYQHQQPNQPLLNSQHFRKKSETGDLSMSGESDMDNDFCSGNKPSHLRNFHGPDDEVFSNEYSKQNTMQSVDNSSHYPINSTMNRLEAIFWRQLLANISYEVLNTILFTGSVKIDHEIGTQLLNGINWLDNWLRIRRLDKHKRPLNMLIQVANLLATPRKQLFKMTWNEMREAHPYIPPALLRFLLEEYEDGLGAQNTNNWSIDEKDAAVVDEDPTELIEMSLKGWRSKERLLPAKTYLHQPPLYKPMDPYGLCVQNAMQNCINQLDEKLSASQTPLIRFRWQQLIREFPPPRVIPQIHVDRHHNFNRSTIRHKLAGANRKRLPIRSNNGRLSTSPSTMNQNAIQANSEFSPLPNKTQTNQFNNSVKRTDRNAKFSNDIKPKPSSGEPVWCGNHSLEMSPSQMTSMESNQKALYYVKGLAASVGGIDSIVNGNGDRDILPSDTRNLNNQHSSNKTNYYPQENVYHSQMFNRKVISPHWSSQMLETNRTETPVSSWYHDSRLQVQNGLSQSLGDFSNGFRPPSNGPSLSRLHVDQLNETANDWRQYRMSLLGQGLDKIRTSKAGSRSVTPRLLQNHNVSSSMSNLPTNSLANQFNIPDLVIQEATDNISEIVSELDRARDTDSDAMSSVNLLEINPLSDVLKRNSLGNSISNVTLYKEPNSGFGLVLVDGERTSLDQPGIFVKSVAVNSVADMNGTFRLGDRILAINGRDLTSMTYKDALALLRQCVNQTTFTVLRCNLPDPEALLKRKEI